MSVIVVCRYSSVWSLNHVQVQTGLLKTWMRSFHFCMLTYRNLNYGRQVFAKPLKSVFFLFCVDAEINIWWKTIVYLCCSHFPVSVADESVFIRFISLGFRVFLFFFFFARRKKTQHIGFIIIKSPLCVVWIWKYAGNGAENLFICTDLLGAVLCKGFQLYVNFKSRDSLWCLTIRSDSPSVKHWS